MTTGPIACDAGSSQMHAMPYHRFMVGQTVVAHSGGFDKVLPRGPLVVVRLLPLVNDEPQYIVRSAVDGHERAVLEGQIRPPEPRAQKA
jgi:hypothetical protein